MNKKKNKKGTGFKKSQSLPKFFLFFIILLVCAMGSTNLFAMSAAQVIEQTESLVRQERWDEAEEKLNNFLRENPVKEKYSEKINALRKQVALERAKQAARKKNWNLAQTELQTVLEIDPDNKKVARRLREIEQLRRELEEFKARVSNQTLQTDVRKGWSQDMSHVSPQVQAPVVECVPMTRKSDFDIQQKLNSIFLPKVNFTNAKIEDVAVFLTTQSRVCDPKKNGVTFLVQDEARRKAKNVSMNLRDMPLYEILKYTAQLADVKYRIEDQAVFIEPMKASTQVLVTREFPVRQQFVSPRAEAKIFDDDYKPVTPPQATKVVEENLDAETVKKVLEERGIVFQNPQEEISLPDGTTRKPRADEFPFAMYSPSTGILTVRNSQEQIDFLEQLILSDSADQGRSKLIKVETRVLEINQTDLDELGMNWSLNGGVLPIGAFNLPGGDSGGTQIKLSGATAETNLEGANDLPRSDLEHLIGNPQNISENTLAIQGLLDGVTFQAVLNALSQKKSANLVSAPTILLNSGSGDAVIEVVKEFIYPTAYDPPQVKLYRRDRYGGADETILERVVVPSWPSEFKSPGRKVGVSIRVTKAQADHENKNVTLELKPKITDFDGFIDYGEPILNVPNHIRVPVFTVRAFDEGFKLDIKDGHTMVLGGLIREDVQTIDDKVPVLGDIPFLGYLFRKKTERAVRKNLILFVTPRILQTNGDPVNP